MKDVSAHHRPRRSRLVMGIFLLVLGALLLAVNLGYGLPAGWWHYLPVLLIALGSWGLILPNRHLDRSGGVWMLATGVYLLIGIFDLWDKQDDGGQSPRTPGNGES
jgi:dolichol kinase